METNTWIAVYCTVTLLLLALVFFWTLRMGERMRSMELAKSYTAIRLSCAMSDISQLEKALLAVETELRNMKCAETWPKEEKGGD